MLDVTEYRQAQHMLQRIIDHAPNVIAFKDLDGRIRLVNTRGAHELLGREPEDVVGQSDEELFGSDLAERVRTQDHEVIAAAAPLTFEDDVVQSNGEVRSYLTTKFPIMGADGMPAGIGQISAEVTEMRRAQADRAQLATLVQAAPDAIVTQDRDGLIATWNPGAERIFGLTAEEAIGRPYAETMIPPGERASHAEMDAQIRAGRTLPLRDMRMRADGSKFPAQVSPARLAHDGGTLAIIRDISDLVAAEEALAEHATKLERSNADLERFAYAASHDLQEPLRSMKMGAAMVLAAAADRLDPDERGLLEHIEAAATRLSAQVHGLLEVAQVALGASPQERVPVAVAVQDAVEALRAAADAAAAEIDVQELPAAPVPRAEMSLVLQNLIANAIKYHRSDVAPRITVTGAQSDGHVEVYVADNGVGFTEVESARIFGAFERAQPGVPGTGMGLAVARRMLERHGGSIAGTSDGPGHGSVTVHDPPAGVSADFSEAVAALAPLFGGTDFELRYALDGRAAVRAIGGPLAPRHAEAVPPPAPWVAEARCGDAAGWLLAAAPPADPERARAELERIVERHSALRLQRLAAQRAALEADLLDQLTHHLRTDVSTLQAVAEGAAAGLFDAAELGELPAEIAGVGAAAQRRLSGAREVMTALAAEARTAPEPLLETLRDELEAAGATNAVADVEGESRTCWSRAPDGARARGCWRRRCGAMTGSRAQRSRSRRTRTGGGVRRPGGRRADRSCGPNARSANWRAPATPPPPAAARRTPSGSRTAGCASSLTMPAAVSG